MVYYKCIVMIDRKVFSWNISPTHPRRPKHSAQNTQKPQGRRCCCVLRRPRCRQDRIHARRAARTFGYEGRVTSPTFAIANEYETPTVKVAHFDLYRILDSEALFEIGFDEYLDGSRIVLIEWSENAADVLPEAYKTVHIAYGDADNDRRITIGEVTV